METKVKICGITSTADAQAAVAAGADALGFIFYDKSPRYVHIDEAAAISSALAPTVMRVGVFVNAPGKFVFEAIRLCGLTALQFHGEERPEFCGQFGVMNMKAFRVHGPESLDEIPRYTADAYLLDAFSSTTLGGSGKKFNWDLAVQARRFGRRIFLAGGLTPQNVAAAIRKVRPFGVDVSSGVEIAPGQKDPDKMKAFVKAVRSV